VTSSISQFKRKNSQAGKVRRRDLDKADKLLSVQCRDIIQLNRVYKRKEQPFKPSSSTSHEIAIYGLTAWIAAASLLTLADVIPATEILPSLVA